MNASSRERWWDAALYAGLGALLLAGFALGGWNGVVFIATIGPLLPVAALVPWYFIARHQGLVPRSARPVTVTLTRSDLFVEGLRRPARVALADVAGARSVRNDNWTESKLLDDALTLFDARGRALVRVPLSAAGAEALARALRQQGVAVEERWVSAPAFLD